MDIEVSDVEFPSGSDLCRAWLLVPRAAAGSRPCVVLGHGFGLTRRSGLRAFGEAFARAGYVTLIFDYRRLGDSTGEPRQAISFRCQLEDWAAALSFVRALRSVDPERVVTWGFSLGAGHALAAAATDRSVAGVVAVAPMFSGFSSTLAAMRWWSAGNLLRLASRGALDLIAAALGRPPVRVPLVAPPGALGLLTSPDAYRGFRAIVPPDFDFDVAARIGLYFWSYNPGRRLQALGRPILVLPSKVDKVNPPGPVLRRARKCAHVQIVELDCEHMEIAVEPTRSAIIQATLGFLEEHVPVDQVNSTSQSPSNAS